MFPLALVWVRQQGAWKLHPYNFVAQNCLLLPFWLYIYFLWTMCPMKFSHSYLTLFYVAFLTFYYFALAHHRALILDFSAQSFFLLPNCFKIKSSTHLIQFPWHYEFATLQIITLAPLTPFATCWLATPFFQVSCNPLSGSDTGHHAVWILIILDSWFLIPGRCNLILVCHNQNPYGLF